MADADRHEEELRAIIRDENSIVETRLRAELAELRARVAELGVKVAKLEEKK